MQNKSKSPFKIALSRFIHNKIAMLWILLLIITIISIMTPLIAPFSSEPTRFIKYKR